MARGDMNNAEKNRFKLLQIRFGKDGKVASYNWSGDLTGSTATPVTGKEQVNTT
jgi:hypothetical protein